MQTNMQMIFLCSVGSKPRTSLAKSSLSATPLSTGSQHESIRFKGLFVLMSWLLRLVLLVCAIHFLRGKAVTKGQGWTEEISKRNLDGNPADESLVIQRNAFREANEGLVERKKNTKLHLFNGPQQVGSRCGTGKESNIPHRLRDDEQKKWREHRARLENMFFFHRLLAELENGRFH